MKKQLKCGVGTLEKWISILEAERYLKVRKDRKHLYYFPFETHKPISDRSHKEERSRPKKARIVPVAQEHTVPKLWERTVPVRRNRTKEKNITKELTTAAPLSGAQSADGGSEEAKAAFQAFQALKRSL